MKKIDERHAHWTAIHDRLAEANRVRAVERAAARAAASKRPLKRSTARMAVVDAVDEYDDAKSALYDAVANYDAANNAIHDAISDHVTDTESIDAVAKAVRAARVSKLELGIASSVVRSAEFAIEDAIDAASVDKSVVYETADHFFRGEEARK